MCTPFRNTFQVPCTFATGVLRNLLLPYKNYLQVTKTSKKQLQTTPRFTLLPPNNLSAEARSFHSRQSCGWECLNLLPLEPAFAKHEEQRQSKSQPPRAALRAEQHSAAESLENPRARLLASKCQTRQAAGARGGSPGRFSSERFINCLSQLRSGLTGRTVRG